MKHFQPYYLQNKVAKVSLILWTNLSCSRQLFACDMYIRNRNLYSKYLVCNFIYYGKMGGF